MKKDVVLLTERLVADDKFNAEFFSAATEEQMYALAKTKFPYFTQDDFSQFLQKLQKASDLCEQKLSPEELAEISGGAGGIGKKIASVMFALTAGFGLTGTVQVETNAEITDILDVIGMDIGGPRDYAVTMRSDQLDSVYCFLLGLDPEDGNGEGETIHNVEELINELNLPQKFAETQDDILINIKRTNLKNELRALFARDNWGTEYDSEDSESEDFEAAPLELRLEVFRLLKESAPDLGDTSLSAFLAAFEEIEDNIVYKRDLLENIVNKLEDSHNKVRDQLKRDDLYVAAMADSEIDCGSDLGVFAIDRDFLAGAIGGNWHSTGFLQSVNSGYTWLARELANQSVQAVNSLPDEERNLLLAMDVDRSLQLSTIRKTGKVPDVAIGPGFLQNLANFSIDPTARRRAVSSLNVVEKRDVEGHLQEDLEFPEYWTWNDYKEAISRCIQLGRERQAGKYEGNTLIEPYGIFHNDDLIEPFFERIIGLDDAYGGVPLAIEFNPTSYQIISFRPAIEEIPTEMIIRKSSDENLQPVQMQHQERIFDIVGEQNETPPAPQGVERMEEVHPERNDRDRSNSRHREQSNNHDLDRRDERSEEEQTGARLRRSNRWAPERRSDE